VTSLFWPGDERAADAMSDPAFLRAMLRTEDAWLRVLADAGAVPYVPVAGLVTDADDLHAESEAHGNPVIPLVALLRERLGAAGHDDAARWLHRGLTSQDVVDTALVLCARDAVERIRGDVVEQLRTLTALTGRHRDTPMVARTLTQPAVPTTFGAKAATWLHGVLDTAESLGALRFPVQLGGAAGTLSGLVELLGPAQARQCRAGFARALGLAESPPWHTRRTTVTRIGDAAVSATDAWGRIANDVSVLGRPEIGELSEGAGGGSSTMPNKANPVMSVLIRRAALAAPPLGATLHLAAAGQVDERADGAWHVEWETLATLLRRTVVAAAHTRTLLAGLCVHTEAMAHRLSQLGTDVDAEQRAMADIAGRRPAPAFRGLIDDLIDDALDRARHHLQETP
jgi:3-carboxy-cis,cis-muconate cycloisomerase